MPRDYSLSHVLAITTSFYGHILLAVPARVLYTDKRHPKIHYCNVIFMNRRYIEETGLIHEYEYFRVRAWIGDNDTVHLMGPLPGETEVDLDLTQLFQVTPEQEDLDERNRRIILGDYMDSGCYV